MPGSSTPVQLDRNRGRQGAEEPQTRALEPGRYTVILEPRPAARFLSLMMGLFNARTAEGPVGNYLLRQGSRARRRSARSCSASWSRSRATSATRFSGSRRSASTAWRRSPSPGSRRACSRTSPTTASGRSGQKKEPTPTSPNQSLVMEGSNTTLEEMIKKHAPRAAGHASSGTSGPSISRRCSTPA